MAVACMALPVTALAQAPAEHVTTTTEAVPLEGANSFTENQARDRMVDAGYTDVGALQKDNQGVWRADAKKGGTAVSVAVDFKGNVTSKAR
jgi:putative membrane protein